MRRLWRRLRLLTPLARDRIAAVALLVASEIEVLAIGSGDAPLGLAMLAAVGYSLPLAWRRVFPLGAVLVVVASVVTEAAVITDTTRYFFPFVAVIVYAYGGGAYAEGWRSYAALAAMLGGILAVTLLSPSRVTGDYIVPTAFGAISWLAGRGLRTRTQLTEELHEAAQREEDAHAAELARAAGDERRRIAREMHDVVAHSVSVMVVQAGGARRILDRDPARAVAAAAQIERTGREALAEMRRLLGVLHQDDDEHDVRAPQPGMTGVAALVQRAREAGLPAELEVQGEPRSLPAGLDLAAYRVVQEGLTNALKYSGGAPTDVLVRWRERSLEIEIADRGPGAAAGDAGHGLVGMRERVRLYGGELETGERDGGGFRVRAKLPLVAELEAIA